MQTATLDITPTFQRTRLSDPVITALILDDNKFDRRRIGRISRDMGLPILLDEVASITALCQVLDEERFDLIFLDYLLGEGDGLQALKLVQAHPAHRHCPVIMLAGGDDPGLAVRALQRGCADYLSKSQLTAQGLRRAVVAAIDGAERAAKAEQLALRRQPPAGKA
jgi:PleD family two-component response regulator